MADEQATTANVADEVTPPEQASSQEGLPQEQPTEATAENAEPSEQATTQQESFDNDLEDWAAKKGLDISDENARKAAQMARDSQREFTKTRQQASELDRSLEGDVQDEGVGLEAQMAEFLATQRREKALSQFKEQNPDWQQHEGKMAELALEQVNTPQGPVTRGQLINAGVMSVQDLYAIAKGSNLDSVKEQGAREALNDVATKQRAATPSGAATVPGGSSTRITPQNVEEVYANATTEQLRDPEFQAQVSAAMRSQ